MNISLFLFQFAPLIIYIAVDYLKGFRAGIYAAMITSIVVISYDYFRTGDLDSFMLGESLLIVGLGLVSLKMNNDRYFKFQPTVVAFVFAAIFIYFQIFEKPLLLHFVPHMEKLFRAEMEDADPGPAAEGKLSPSLSETVLANLRSPSNQEFFARVSFGSIWLFLAHGLLMAYAALRLSTRAWFGWRLTIYPAFLLMAIYYQVQVQAGGSIPG